MASTIFWVDPADDLVALYVTQLTPPGFYSPRRERRAPVYRTPID